MPNTINHIPVPSTNSATLSPYTAILAAMNQAIDRGPTSAIHRFIFPSLISPAVYPLYASRPTHVLPFLHSLRSLLRRHHQQITVMITLPLSLYPRDTGLVRWIEHLVDGILELTPFPHSVDVEPPVTTSSGATKAEEKPQGIIKIHKLPVLTDKGGGGGGGDDLAFTLGRKRFVVKPYSLPPLEGDNEAQRGEPQGGVLANDIEF